MTDKWTGIILPSQPPPDASLWIGLVLACLLIVIVLVLYRQRTRLNQRQLRQLQRSLARQELPSRQIGFKLAKILRQRFVTCRLDQLQFERNQTDWQVFLDKLQRSQYAATPVSGKAMENLLREAGLWIHR